MRSIFTLERLGRFKTLIAGLILASGLFAGQAFANKTLILYDTGGDFGLTGVEHGIMAGNLAGHFNAKIRRKPVKRYSAGEMEKYDVIFYMGTSYNERDYYEPGSAGRKAYNAFLADAATTKKTLVWHNYNIWELAWNWNAAWGATSFSEKFGFTVQGADSAGFNRVDFKGVELTKGVIRWANPGAALTGCAAEGGNTYACAQEIVRTTVIDPDKAKVLATTRSTINPSAGTHPYALKSGRFFFFADIPTSFTSEEDRYLAYSELLHRVFKSGVAQQPLRAIIRLEDISAGTGFDDFKAVTEYLKTENIPFAVATVPLFKDPQGLGTGLKQTVRLDQSPIGSRLKRLHRQGAAEIVTHGYSHQLGRKLNPINGMTGDDFEFYRADFKAIRTDYKVHYGRTMYFPKAKKFPNRFVGQFFPYVTQDLYGYTVLPENMGNIVVDPIPGFRKLFPEDLLNHADKLRKVVRDPIGSFYYHTFLGVDYLREVVDGMRAQGWEFVSPCSVVDNCPE